MLELDFVLARYLDNHYDQADDAEKILFKELLTAQDPELQLWILNGQKHPSADVQALIDKIRGI